MPPCPMSHEIEPRLTIEPPPEATIPSRSSTDWKLGAELLTYSRSKGLLAGIDLDGTSVSQNTEDTNAFYGSPHPFEEVLKGEVPTPETAKPFVQTVAKYSQATRQQSLR